MQQKCSFVALGLTIKRREGKLTGELLDKAIEEYLQKNKG